MLKKVKLFIVALLVLLFIGSVYAFITRQRAPKISTTPLPEPEIPKTFEGKPSIVVSVEKKDFDFPKVLSVLKTAPSTISGDESRKIANKLGLNFEPVVVPDVIEGTKHRYTGSNYVLLLALKTGKIDYVRNLILGEIANKQLSDKDIIKVAEDFLIKNELVSSEEVNTLSVSYYEKRSSSGLYQTTREDAYFYQVNFSTSISEIPVLTLNPQNSPVYVRVLPDGTILKAHVEKLGQVTQNDQVRRLKKYDGVIGSKESAILISLDEGNVYLPDIPADSIKQITITEIELAYLIESSTTQVLQPIFLLKGLAGVSGFPNELKAVLYLPAISETR